MTRKDSSIRLVLYISAATLSAASAGLQSVDFADPRQVVGLALGTLIAAVTAWRAYIDQSPAQIEKP
jgi:uncharacterized membrane protein